MKARVKATGEFIDVEKTILPRGECYINMVGEMIDAIYMENELDFGCDCNYNPDYWTRLEHQYAGMAMQGILSNQGLVISVGQRKDKPFEDIISTMSYELAHALVEKMREEK